MSNQKNVECLFFIHANLKSILEFDIRTHIWGHYVSIKFSTLKKINCKVNFAVIGHLSLFMATFLENDLTFFCCFTEIHWNFEGNFWRGISSSSFTIRWWKKFNCKKKHEKKSRNVKHEHFNQVRLFSNKFTGFDNNKNPVAPLSQRLHKLIKKFIEAGLKHYPTQLCKLLWDKSFALDKNDKKKWKSELSELSTNIKSDFDNLMYVHLGKVHHLLFQQLGIFSNYFLGFSYALKFLINFNLYFFIANFLLNLVLSCCE